MASQLKILYVAIGIILAVFHFTSGAAHGVYPPETVVVSETGSAPRKLLKDSVSVDVKDSKKKGSVSVKVDAGHFKGHFKVGR